MIRACYELMPIREFHIVRFHWRPHRFKLEGLFFKKSYGEEKYVHVP